MNKTGASARTVTKHRAIISAVFNYGAREPTFKLPANPARAADKRREPHRDALVYDSVEEVEALARALADGRHREASTHEVSEQEHQARSAEDQQDGEMVGCPHAPGCASESCSPCAGATWTSPAMLSRSGAR